MRVLAAMVPELSYKNLDTVQDGGSAQQAYFKAINLAGIDAGVPNIDFIREQLLAYCELDTFAMVKIWQVLNSRAAR